MRRILYLMLLIPILAVCMAEGPSSSSRSNKSNYPQVGQPAPPLEGADADGKPLKLSDFRGKVVVVDFWATWCGPCCDLIPHEKELVQRMQGRPFVLLGISNDNEAKDLKSLVEKRQINWPNLFDGYAGPQTKAWGVGQFPTMHVVDAKGVVRYLDVEGSALDSAVDKLVKEAESGK